MALDVLGRVFSFLARKPKTPPMSIHEARYRLQGDLAPTLVLEPAMDDVFSKLGGLPDLDNEVAWPIRWGRPAPFLAQLDLAEVRASGGPDWLPEAGRLFFFGAADGDGPASVIHRIDDPAPAAKITPPAVGKKERTLFKERRVQMRRALSLNDAADLPDDLGEMPASFASEVLGFNVEGTQHRIGGYHDPVQGGDLQLYSTLYLAGFSPEQQMQMIRSKSVLADYAKEAKAWRLLLQIDYDPALGIKFGDGARVYFLVREQDARVGDFSKVMTFSEGH